MNGQVFCFVSAKGGTGKTSLSASMATLLGALGKKVLLIDFDAATNGLTLLYLQELANAKLQEGTDDAGLFGIFEITGSLPASLINVSQNVDFIPSTFHLKQIQETDIRDFAYSLNRTIRGYRQQYDFIFIDSQAGSDVYSQAAIESADQNIIVTEFDPISLAGVDRMKALFPNHLSFDKSWLLFNKVLPDIADSISDNLSIARYLRPVPWSQEVMLALVRRKLAVDVQKGNLFTIALLGTLKSLLGDSIQIDIDSWIKDKEETLRKPIIEQIGALQRELSAAERARLETVYSIARLEKRPRNIALGNAAALITVITLASMWVIFARFYSSFYTILAWIAGTFLTASSSFFLYKFAETRTSQIIRELYGQLSALDTQIRNSTSKLEELTSISNSRIEQLVRTR